MQGRVDPPRDAVVHLHDPQPRLGGSGNDSGKGAGVPRDAARERFLGRRHVPIVP